MICIWFTLIFLFSFSSISAGHVTLSTRCAKALKAIPNQLTTLPHVAHQQLKQSSIGFAKNLGGSQLHR
jgi:hypothetical protein